VEPHASADSGPGRDAAHEPNDTNRAGGGLDLREGELKAAVSVATAQLSQDLLVVGSQVSSIETGHRALMERLHRIAERADERALRQFGSLQEQVEDARRQILSAREDLEVVRGSFLDADKRALHQFGSLQAQVEDARRQILSAREDLEVVRGSFLEQLQLIRGQCESAQQQLHTTEQRFNETEQQLHIAEGRVQAAEDKHNSVEQRLRAAEQKNLDGERKWQRTDDWLQTTRNQLESFELQLQTTVQQLQEFQQQLADADTRVKSQLTDADVLIKSLGPDIKSCEQRVERNTAEIAEIQKIVEEHVTRRKYVQVSIDDLTRDVNQFKVHIPKLTGDDEQIKSLHAMFRSNRRMHRFVVAASIVSLLMVLYIGLGKTSWPTIAHYLSLWVPGLKL
jgi:chromosome segregation ATPase